MQQKSGDELFTNQEMYLNYSLSDFWGWYASNLLHGALRGAVAEYIVSRALDLPTNECRQDWEAFDVVFGTKRIEVKSCAYYQSSEQDKPSRISFNISKHTRWNEETKWNDSKRESDLYIFCLLGDSDDKGTNPMDVSQWSFYVLPTSVIDEKLGDQKTISLSALLELNPVYSTYDDLKQSVERTL